MTTLLALNFQTYEDEPVLAARSISGLQKAVGQAAYQAYAGACTWLNGVFMVQTIRENSDGTLLVENLHDVGKIRVEQLRAAVEPDLVYPLLRGRDVGRWRAEPSTHIILTQDPETRRGIPEATMKRRYSKTFAYLKKFEAQLRKRSGYRQYYTSEDPFYSIYNVGPYTLAPWKVYWTRVASDINAAVAGGVGPGNPILSVETATFVPFQDPAEAHYFCALMNSSPCRLVIQSYSSKGTGSFGSPHVLTHVSIPKFSASDKDHSKLATLSADAHAAVGRSDDGARSKAEREIDRIAARVWGITVPELDGIRQAIDDARNRGITGPEGDSDESEDE